MNSVESLSGDVDLMSVRSKGRINRSFDVITEMFQPMVNKLIEKRYEFKLPK